MIVTLLAWIILSYLFVETGRIAYRNSEHTDPLLYWITGFAAISALAQLISILMPLGDVFFPALLISILITQIFNKKRKLNEHYSIYREWFGRLRKLPLFIKGLLASGLLMILYKSSVSPHHFDSGLYHIQAIKWIEEYPVVPGLANFDIRLGFNSIWFVCSAFTSFKFAGFDLHALNGLLYLVGFLYGLRSIRSMATGDLSPWNWIGILFPLSWFILAKNISSPSPDMPASAMVWLCAYYFMIEMSERTGRHFVTITILAVIAVTIKLSVMLVLILPFWMLINMVRKKDYSKVRTFLTIAVLLIGPWIARNIILTGYAVFPITATATQKDWKVPEEEAKELANVVKAWARIPAQPTDEVLAKPLTEWLPVWFNTSAVVMPYDQVFIGLFILALITFIISLIARKGKCYNGQDALTLVMLAGIILWFMSAPDFRFVYGFLLVFIVMGLQPVLNWVMERLSNLNLGIIISSGIFLMMAVTTYAYSQVFIKDPSVSAFAIEPEPLPKTQFQTIKIQNQNIHIIFDPDCQRWATPLPATCQPEILTKVQFRGKGLNSGFRRIQN